MFHATVGEESTNTDNQRKQFSAFFKDLDPYNHPIVASSHAGKDKWERVYAPLLGYPTFDGASLNAEPRVIFDTVLEWVQRSAAAGKKWIVSSDAQSASVGVAPDSEDPLHDSIRKDTLWATIMAGGRYVL